MTTEQETTNVETLNLNALDVALAEARARKAAKEAVNGTTSVGESPSEALVVSRSGKVGRPALTEKEKTEREARRAAEREERKQARAAKKALRVKPPAHLTKVQKAADKLAPLSEASQLVYNEAIAALTAPELANLAQHIGQYNRQNATLRALDTQLVEGARVRIIGGDPRYVGQTGIVARVQRIRCFVTLDSSSRDAYCFTSDVEPVVITEINVTDDTLPGGEQQKEVTV